MSINFHENYGNNEEFKSIFKYVGTYTVENNKLIRVNLLPMSYTTGDTIIYMNDKVVNTYDGDCALIESKWFNTDDELDIILNKYVEIGRIVSYNATSNGVSKYKHTMLSTHMIAIHRTKLHEIKMHTNTMYYGYIIVSVKNYLTQQFQELYEKMYIDGELMI